MAVAQVTLSADGRTVEMRKGGWRIEFEVDELPRWLSFYRRLRDRKGGRYARHFADDVAGLEAAAREARRVG